MIDLVGEETSNRAVPSHQANQMMQERFQVASAVYFPYNQGVKDAGWGCAWRAIQTLLSSKNIHTTFQQLYQYYSSKNTLMNIAKTCHHLSEASINILQERKWAPEETPNHWAEPYIGSLICWHLGIPNSLLLLNGYPKSANAPLQVFQTIISFPELLYIVQSRIKNTTIMIDDSKFALSIIGFCQCDPETVELLFADPHIKSNREARDVGLYSKKFDLKGRSKGEDTRSEHQKTESLYNVYQSLQFETKQWMICFLH